MAQHTRTRPRRGSGTSPGAHLQLVGLVLATPLTRLLPGGIAVLRTNTTASPTPLRGAWSAGAVRPRLRLALDPYRVTLFLITVLTISRIHQHFPMLAKVRPILVLYLFAVLIIVLNPRSVTLANSFRTWPPKLVAALGVVACISAPFGISLGASGSFLLHTYASVLFYAFLLFIGIRCARELYTLVWAFVVGIALLVWQALAIFHLAPVIGTSVERLAEMYSYDANDLGCVLMVGLVLTTLTFLTAQRKGKVASAALLVGIGIALARSGSRGAFLGLLGTGCALLLSLKRVSVVKRIGFVVIVAVGLALAAPPGYWTQISTVLSPTKDYNWDSSEGRVEIWRRGMDYMLDHPVFGIGINNFERAEGTISEKVRRSFAGDPIRWTAPHNSFVQVGAELGIPGLILWTSLVVGAIVGVTRLRRRLPREWPHGDPEERFLYLATIHVPLAVVGFAITAFFLSFAYLDPIYVLAALVSGLYVAVTEKARRTRLLG